MSMHLSVEAYEILEKTFSGKDEAKKFLNALEEAIVNGVQDSWYRTKEELKAEVFSEFATKRDLEQVRIELLGEMKKDKAELLGKIEALYEKTEKDKAELLGIMKQDKAELLGIMKQDKAELLLKMEQMNKKFSIYFVTLLFVIIFLNQNALEFIAKVIGLLK
ncbi:MAG: hypothetical protein WHV26_15105 [Spirochaetota bacterium]